MIAIASRSKTFKNVDTPHRACSSKTIRLWPVVLFLTSFYGPQECRTLGNGVDLLIAYGGNKTILNREPLESSIRVVDCLAYGAVLVERNR